MMRALLPLLLLLGAISVTAEAAPRASCPETTVAADRVAAMARGFNLVGWLDRAEPRIPSPAFLGSLRKLGFSHVRLPVDGELFVEGQNERRDIEDRLLTLDMAVTTLLGQGYAVTVDLHPSGAFNTLHAADPEAGYRRLEEIWRTVAPRLARHSPERVFVELLNEPAVDVPTWRAQVERLAAVVRAILPEHTLVVGTAEFQRIEPLAASAPLADPNVVYAVHYYDPMVFTHQGADWAPDGIMERLDRVPFPAGSSDKALAAKIARLDAGGYVAAADAVREAYAQPWTPARIDAALVSAAAWGRTHRRPVIVNEFGVLGWKADRDARGAWIRAVRVGAERHCLGWTHWEYDEGFGFVASKDGVPEVDMGVVDALLGPARR